MPTDTMTLYGTPKQVQWAQRIRTSKLRKAEAFASRPRLFDDAMPGFPQALADLRDETSASWWIDQRDVDAVSLLEERRKAAER